MTPREIRAERRRLGLSQERYATLLGLNQASISAWELGKARPGRESLTKIEAARGLSRPEAEKRVARGQAVRVKAPRRRTVLKVPEVAGRSTPRARSATSRRGSGS